MNLFTDEQKEYFLSIVKGRQSKKLAQMMNDKFGLDVTAAQICTYKSKYGITSYYERPYARTEDAVKDFVIANAGGITNRERVWQRVYYWSGQGYKTTAWRAFWACRVL